MSELGCPSVPHHGIPQVSGNTFSVPIAKREIPLRLLIAAPSSFLIPVDSLFVIYASAQAEIVCDPQGALGIDVILQGRLMDP